MMLGTAGFTALLCSFAVKAKEELLLGEKVKDVLVTGATGGVGSIAVMILSKMGYDVHAVTGKKDKNDYLKNLGAKNIADRILSNKQIGLLGINIGPNKDTNNRHNDYIECLKAFHRIADYITINISSPNTEELRNFHDQNKLNKLLQIINNEKTVLNSNIPIVVKVSPDIKDQEIPKISDVLLKNNIEAVILSNTSDSTRDELNDIQKHQKGGLSGKPIEEKSTKLIEKFYEIIGKKIKIIGVGGVDSGISAYKKFLAGASYIQLYTGMVYRGPNIVNLIKKELKELMLKDGVKHFSEIIGKKTIS